MNIINIELNEHYNLTIKDVDLISKRKASLRLSQSPLFRDKINQGADFLKQQLMTKGFIYGVTTGYGDDCTRNVPIELVGELPTQLSRFHGCGLGKFLSIPQTRAVIAVRLASLCRGFSGVSFELLERLALLLDKDILPLIPSEGSVGASGDLTPLSYIVAVLIGEREVWYEGTKQSTAAVYEKLKIKPYQLQPKESLAIMNGTAVMTALAIEAFNRAEYLVLLSARLTSMTSLALQGNPIHFDEALFLAKPHAGMIKIAHYIRSDLQNAPLNFPTARLQDRYSTRCAPHIIGVLADFLPIFKSTIEIEINSANDNPLIDIHGDQNRILHGGHFYGGHIAFVMDSLKILVANLADLMDRQMATLVDSKFNNGLPANLSGATGDRSVINHGLKALQIAASAWTAEALKGTLPASIFSRSTESHNQDKVSMGTIAARDALRVLELTEQVAAAQLIAALQAVRLRERDGSLTDKNYSNDMITFKESLANALPFISEDVPLDNILRDLLDKIQNQSWQIYGAES